MGSLRSYLQGGWADSYHRPFNAELLEVGYYQHAGYVYCVGEITNIPAAALVQETEGLAEVLLYNKEAVTPWPAVDQTILSGLPPQLCPPEDVSIVLPIDPQLTTDPATAALNMPTHYHTTVHPDGSWTFDDPLPPYLNEPPPAATYYYAVVPAGHGAEEFPPEEHLPQYLNPLVLTLVIGNARWPTVAGTDTYKTKSLVPFIAGAMTSSDAAYAIHGTRVHLAGHAAAGDEGPAKLVTHGPLNAYEAVPEFDGEPTTAVGPTGPIPLRCERNFGSRGEVDIMSDQPIHKVTDDPPLSVTSPVRGRGWFDGQGGRNFKTVSSDPQYLAPSGGGLLGVGPQIVRGPTFECEYKLSKLEKKGLVVYCLGPEQLPDLNFDVAAVLASIVPQPDWFTLELSVEGIFRGYRFVDATTEFPPLETLKEWEEAGTQSLRASTYCKEFIPLVSIGCGNDVRPVNPWFDVSGGLLPPGDLEKSIAEREEASTFHEADGPTWSGALFPPTALYKGVCFPGEEHKPYTAVPWYTGQLASRLWRADQATNINVHFLAEVGWGASWGYVNVTPMWEMRQFGLHKGDSLDLGLTGWRATAGEVEIGPESKAIIPRP